MAHKENQNTNKGVFNKLGIATIILTGLSIFNVWWTGLINHYFYTPDFKGLYVFLLLLTSAMAFVGSCFAFIALFKASWKQRIAMVACLVICLVVAGLQLFGAAFSNMF